MRFGFLDAVRAIAALYVFAEHTYYMQWRWTGVAFYNWGHEAVATFIVLSGFCLGLQLHKSQAFWAYIGRRSRRLLPPYYAAVVLVCLLLILNAKMHGIDLQIPLDELLPVVFLVKELANDHVDWLAGSVVFWTIGIEYRCYWLLPLMAWCFRKQGFWGLGASALIFYGFAASILAALHLPTGHAWFILSFAIGVAASQAIGRNILIKYSLYALATVFLVVKSGAEPTDLYWAATELLFSAIVALLLLGMAQAVKQGKENQAIKLLAHPLLEWLAGWSYSLYLIHYVMLVYSNRWLSQRHVTGWSAIALEILPVLLVCYLFSLVFERPFAARLESRHFSRPL